MNGYDISFNGSAHRDFPVELVYGLLWHSADEALSLFPRYPFMNGWGGYCHSQVARQENPENLPHKLSLCYLSIIERKYYDYEADLTSLNLKKEWDECAGNPYEGFLAGMAPYGHISLWLYSRDRSRLLLTGVGKPVDINPADYVPFHNGESLETRCRRYTGAYPDIFGRDGRPELPPERYFRRLSDRYTYRYLFQTYSGKEGKWINPDSDKTIFKVCDTLFDGSFNKLGDDSLLRHHTAGKPKIISVTMISGKSETHLHFFFDETAVSEVFERFYGVHHDTRADFIIRVDAPGHRYELCLYRQGLKEPVTIPAEAYKVIVFRNRFEEYRSDNYDLPRGAWIW